MASKNPNPNLRVIRVRIIASCDSKCQAREEDEQRFVHFANRLVFGEKLMKS